MPKWKPELINQFHQDDIYVEMTFLRTLEIHGWDVSIRQAGIDFANSGYPLWHANRFGRENLRAGIAPPDSGHPKFNAHADDIDYQIEADYAGLIAPGMPNLAIELGEKFGRLMNYGDGLYGGQFVGGMYAEAFFNKDPLEIVEAGLQCVPDGSQFAECIRDVITWYEENPDDWQKTWELIEAKYQDNPDYRRASCDKGDFNIDAKINAAYIVMGLLYGEGDMDKTIIISTRCGQDSDCNPANAAGVLGTAIGRKNLPKKFTSAINPEGVFSHTAYTFPALIEVSEKLVRQAVVREGGKIEETVFGKEILLIPVESPKPSRLEQCWEPGPVANSRFTEEEMAKITAGSVDRQMQASVDKLFPGWKISKCGADLDPRIHEEFGGKKTVLMTHPLNRSTACVLTKNVERSQRGKKTLHLVVGHNPRGNFKLIVKIDGKPVTEKIVGPKTTTDGWEEISVELPGGEGKPVKVELLNAPNGWSFEAAYWASIAVVSE